MRLVLNASSSSAGVPRSGGGPGAVGSASTPSAPSTAASRCVAAPRCAAACRNCSGLTVAAASKRSWMPGPKLGRCAVTHSPCCRQICVRAGVQKSLGKWAPARGIRLAAASWPGLPQSSESQPAHLKRLVQAEGGEPGVPQAAGTAAHVHLFRRTQQRCDLPRRRWAQGELQSAAPRGGPGIPEARAPGKPAPELVRLDGGRRPGATRRQLAWSMWAARASYRARAVASSARPNASVATSRRRSCAGRRPSGSSKTPPARRSTAASRANQPAVSKLGASGTAPCSSGCGWRRALGRSGRSHAADDAPAQAPACSSDTPPPARTSRDTRPCVGRKPRMPQCPAGTRTLPPVSPPSPRSASPCATAAAVPLDDPPGMRPGAAGLVGVP